MTVRPAPLDALRELMASYAFWLKSTPSAPGWQTNKLGEVFDADGDRLATVWTPYVSGSRVDYVTNAIGHLPHLLELVSAALTSAASGPQPLTREDLVRVVKHVRQASELGGAADIAAPYFFAAASGPQQETLVEQRVIGHGDGQRDALADVNAGRVEDLIQPRLRELNAWRELGEEMGRIVSMMTPEDATDYLPDWFGPRLFDLQVNGAASRGGSPTQDAPPQDAKRFGPTLALSYTTAELTLLKAQVVVESSAPHGTED